MAQFYRFQHIINNFILDVGILFILWMILDELTHPMRKGEDFARGPLLDECQILGYGAPSINIQICAIQKLAN